MRCPEIAAVSTKGNDSMIAGNWFKTGLLMAAIVGLFGTVGGMLGGSQGMLLALLIGIGTNFWAYWFSDKMVLRMYNAQPVDATSAPQVWNIVEELTRNAQLP